MRTIVLVASASLLAALSFGCASTPGARPHDMGVAEHQAMAASDERAAAGHEAQSNSAASDETWRCGAGRSPSQAGICWSDLRNPTLRHHEQSEQLLKEAADHSAASQALRDAEAKACVGLDAHDRDISPFAHREDIASVQILRDADEHEQGAVITFGDVPGLTAQSLQRLVDCHMARNAALGHVVPGTPWCPLVPNYISASVGQSAGHLTVTIISGDSSQAREVAHRAELLKSPE